MYHKGLTEEAENVKFGAQQVIQNQAQVGQGWDLERRVGVPERLWSFCFKVNAIPKWKKFILQI